MSSTASRRPAPRHSTRSSFRLSVFSRILIGPDSDISGNTIVDAPSFHTPDMRLSDLATSTNSDSDTPALSEDTPFNDTRALPKYGVDTPLSPTELEPRVASTPLCGSIACKPLGCNTCSHDARFSEHLDCSMSMTTSVSTCVSASGSSTHSQDGHDLEHGHEQEDGHAHTDTSTGTIPLGESNDSLFTTSASASASSSLTANETPAPTTPPTPSPSPVPSPSLGATPSTGKGSVGRSMLPVLAKHLRRLSLSGTSPDREQLVNKLRGLRSLSRSRSGSGSGSGSESGSGSGSPLASVWRGSPARSVSSRSDNLTPSPSPVKGSGIPVLQRRMTIRARRTSVKKV